LQNVSYYSVAQRRCCPHYFPFGYSSIVITEEVAESTNPITFHNAENCLNFQRALLEKLMT
jgi:ornithine carbamoyltransferase